MTDHYLTHAYHEAYVADARSAHALFTSMRTDDLLMAQAAHQADQVRATTPESLAFGAGRLALIADVLRARAVPRGTLRHPDVSDVHD